MSTIAPAVVQLRAEVNARCPERDKSSDGIIGDARHAALGNRSDHNPWLHDTYRALDLDSDLEGPGIDAGSLAEHLRRLGEAGDPRLVGGGCVIYRRKIASDASRWQWVPYTGADPHLSHLHVSVSRSEAGYGSAAGWGIAPAPAAPASTAAAGRLLEDGRIGLATVRALQAAVGATIDGNMGALTNKALQRHLGVAADGRLGTVTIKALQQRVGAPVDGRLGTVTIKALQRALNAGTL